METLLQNSNDAVLSLVWLSFSSYKELGDVNFGVEPEEILSYLDQACLKLEVSAVQLYW